MTHVFFSKAYRNRIVTPSRVVVQSRPDDDPQYQGEAIDTESHARLPRTEYYQTYLESNAQAVAIANAKLSKAQLWSDAGALNVPMNVGQETYDYIRVIDSREGDTRTGNIGTLTRRYTPTKNRWETVFSFGNWQSVRKALADLGITADDIENYFSRLSVGHLYAENLLSPNMGFVWIDPDNTIDLSKIGDNLDNLPDGEQYARVSTWNLSLDERETINGLPNPTYHMFVLNMDEHTIYQPGYDANEKRRTFTATPTTPYDVGDLWLDADTVKRCITARATGAYVSSDWMATTLDAIAEGTTYQRVKSMALSADGLVLLDQVTVGTYGLVKSTDITAGHIKLAACYGDLDDIDEGSTYGKLRTTDIDAGHLKLSSYTKVSGEWYDEAGVEIDANYGINIYGQNNALTTRATKTGTIQCYVGSDGKIYAGAGNVWLDSAGISFKGSSRLRFYNTLNSWTGVIGCSTDTVYLHGAQSGDKVEVAGAEVRLLSDGYDIVLNASSGKGIDGSGSDYMNLPRRTSAPTGYNGRMVFNSNTGYTNIYFGGAWHHLNRDAGWA